MSGFETYKLFLALNNHFFQQNYDFFRYKGGVPVKVDTYEAKSDQERHRYERLSRKFSTQEEIENFIVANMLESKKRMWIGSLAGAEPDTIYNKWLGRTQAIRYNLISELKKLVEQTGDFNKLFSCDQDQHPEILKAQMRGEISIESFVLLDMCLGFVPSIDKKLADDRNWMVVKNKTVKYKPFLERLDLDIKAVKQALFTAVKDATVPPWD